MTESPCWLAMHGREKEGEAVGPGLERRFLAEGAHLKPAAADAAIRLRSRDHTPLAEVSYAIGAGLGASPRRSFFCKLIESGSRPNIFGGYLSAAVLTFAAAFVATRYAVAAERKPLKQVAPTSRQ